MGPRVAAALMVCSLACASACGTLLGFSGDDEPTPPSPVADGSIDANEPNDAGGSTDAPTTQDSGTDAAKDSGGCLSPPCERYVFVTSLVYTGSLGGTSGADDKCKGRADNGDARLKGRTFIAYLSSSAGGDSPAGARLNGNGPPFKRLDGQVVADDKSAFVAGPLKVGINRDEDNQSVSGAVWTGTAVGGTSSGDDCNGWAQDNGVSGTFGNVGAAANPSWVNAGAITCSESRHLYCVEP